MWKKLPSGFSIANSEVVFAFMAVEVVIMALLMRLSKLRVT